VSAGRLVPERIAPEARRQLAILATAMVLSMSTWFSTAAVLGQLRIDWGLDRNEASWLTIVVQLGFVVGAVASSLTNLADRVPRAASFSSAQSALRPPTAPSSLRTASVLPWCSASSPGRASPRCTHPR